MWFHHVISLSIFFGEAGRYRRQHALQREQRELRRRLRLTLARGKPGGEEDRLLQGPEEAEQNAIEEAQERGEDQYRAENGAGAA